MGGPVLGTRHAFKLWLPINNRHKGAMTKVTERWVRHTLALVCLIVLKLRGVAEWLGFVMDLSQDI